MFTRLQLVVLGLVISQGVTLSAMENKVPNSPRNALSCSQESRLKEGDVLLVGALKRSLEVRKEEKNQTINMYYPWPGAHPKIYSSNENIQDSMKPWFPHSHWY